MYMQHYTNSNTKNPKDLRTHHTTGHNPSMEKTIRWYQKRRQLKNLDENNQKRLKNVFENFLYYTRAVDPTMLVALKSLAAVQTKPKIETAKQVTQFLNYSATYTYAVTEYRKSGMILHIYSDVSYISEPEAQSRAGEYFF